MNDCDSGYMQRCAVAIKMRILDITGGNDAQCTYSIVVFCICVCCVASKAKSRHSYCHKVVSEWFAHALSSEYVRSKNFMSIERQVNKAFHASSKERVSRAFHPLEDAGMLHWRSLWPFRKYYGARSHGNGVTSPWVIGFTSSQADRLYLSTAYWMPLKWRPVQNKLEIFHTKFRGSSMEIDCVEMISAYFGPLKVLMWM